MGRPNPQKVTAVAIFPIRIAPCSISQAVLERVCRNDRSGRTGSDSAVGGQASIYSQFHYVAARGTSHALGRTQMDWRPH